MNVSRNGVFAIMQVALAAVALALVYRHIIAVLGAQQLGVWSVTFSLASLASLGDLGVTAAAVREVARARADQDWRGMRQIATTCAVFGPIGMFVAGLALAGPLHAAGASLLGKTALAVPLELTLIALAVTICTGLSIGATGIVEAFERYDLKTALVAAGYVTLIALAWLLVRPLGLLGFGLALLGQALVNLCGALFIAMRLAPGSLFARDALSIGALRVLLRTGLPLRTSGFLNIALEPLTRVLMVRFGGPEQAAIYEVVTRVVSQVRTVAVSAMQVIIPRLVLIHRSSGRTTDSSLETYLRMTTSGALLIFTTLALCLPAMSQFILGSVKQSFVVFGTLLCAAWFVNVLAVPSYFANIAHGTLRGNWLSHATFAALNVALGIGFGTIGGAEGVVIGTSTAIVLGSLVTVFDRVRRDAGSMVYGDRVMFALLACGVGIAMPLIASESVHVFASSWLAWLAGASLFAVAGAVCIVVAFRQTLVQVFPHMKLLIAEPHASGHHAPYLRWIIEGCQARKADVVLATTTAVLEHPLLRESLPDSGVRTLVFDAPPANSQPGSRLSMWREQLAYRSLFGQWAAQALQSGERVDAVLLPYIEYCFHSMAVLGSPFGTLPWAGISMRLSAVDGASRDSAKWWVARRLLRQPSLVRLFSINPSIAGPAARSLAGRSHEKLCYLPDPAEQRLTMSRVTARSRLGIGADRTVLLVFGSLSERKGVRELLRSLRADWPERLCVILAGAQDAAIRSLLGAPETAADVRAGRLLVRDFVHDDTDEALVYAASDIAWLAYIDHPFMSGVLVAAGRAGLPVIATRQGEIGHLTQLHGSGTVIDPNDAESIHAGVRRLLDPSVRLQCAEAARALFARHSPDDFVEKLLTHMTRTPMATRLRA